MEMNRILIIACLVSTAFSKEIGIGIGTGINSGKAIEYDSYSHAQLFHFTPHFKIDYSPSNTGRFGFCYSNVTAKKYSVCLIFVNCSEKYNENYQKLNLIYLFQAKRVFFGPNIFWLFGENSYVAKGDPINDIEVHGRLKDAYRFIGIGGTIEKNLSKHFNVGSNLEYLSQVYHKRDNSLIRDDIYGGSSEAIVYLNDSRSAYFNFGVYVQIQANIFTSN